MKFKGFLVSTCALTLSALVAVSAPLADEQKKYNWEGFYLGISPKYTYNNFANFFADKDAANSADKEKQKKKAAISDSVGAGIFIGYNLVVKDNYLLGAEAGFVGKYHTKKNPEGFTDWLYDLVKLPTLESEVKVRLGLVGLLSDRFFPYIYAGMNFNTKNPIVEAAKTQDTSLDGKTLYSVPLKAATEDNISAYNWVIGGGVDLALTSSLILRAEYHLATSTKFNDVGSMLADLKDTLPSLISRDKLNAYSHTLKFGLAYKF